MEFDPLSRDVPPSRHDVESDSDDSEDEEHQNQQRNSSKGGLTHTKKVFKRPSFTLKNSEGESINTQLPTSSSLIIFIGTSGEAFVRENVQFVETFALFNSDNGQQQGSFHQSKSEIYALIRPDTSLTSQQVNLSCLASYLHDSLHPSKVVIIDEYYPALYLSEVEREYGEAPPIRILNASQPALSLSASNKKIVQDFVAPNYITGLGAALLTQASKENIAASLVLLPQERSVNPHLQTLQRAHNTSSSISDRPEVLDTSLPQNLISFLSIQTSNRSKPASRTLDTFLNERRITERKKQQNEISAMYM